MLNLKESAFAELMKLADKYFLSQVIHDPTRKNNTLDLCFTNDPNSFLSIETIPFPSVSDHNMIRIQTSYSCDTTQHTANHDVPEIASFNYENADKKVFREAPIKALNVNMAEQLSMTSEQYKSFLTQQVVHAATEAATEAGVTKVNSSKKRKYFSHRKLFQKRCRIYKSLSKRPQDLSLKNSLAEVDIEIKAAFKSQQEHAETKAISKIKDDPRFFFKYASSKRNKLT